MALAEAAVGVDLGAGRLWVVALSTDARPSVISAASVDVGHESLRAFAASIADARAVAIDAPAEASAGCHVDDDALPPKFRTARCCEIALRAHGIAVPWTTPIDVSAAAGWMQTGFAVWSALRDVGHEPLEVYPHGIFTTLLGMKSIPKKQSAEGRALRIAALADHVDLPPGIGWWPHDGIDALAAALVAWQHARGTALRIVCDPSDGRAHDSSAIWLPTV